MCVCVYACIQACSLTQLCPTFATPLTAACQASLSIGLSQQENGVGCALLQVSSWPRIKSHNSYISCIGRFCTIVLNLGSLSLTLLGNKFKLPRQTAATVCSTEFAKRCTFTSCPFLPALQNGAIHAAVKCFPLHYLSNMRTLILTSY